MPGTAIGTLGVAAFTSRAPTPPWAGEAVGDLAPFSSPGPLRAITGRRAIDAALPGHEITSARNGGGLVAMSGTSMATPVLTGLVAGLLQQNPQLTTGQIRNRLEAACTLRPADPATGRPADSPDDWGFGRLDASRLRP